MICAQFLRRLRLILLIATTSLTGCAYNDVSVITSIQTGDNLASVISKLNEGKIVFKRIDLNNSGAPRRAIFMLYAETKDALNPEVIAVGFDESERVVENGVQIVSSRYTKPSEKAFFIKR
jgi:hypothetical protein